MCAVLLRWSRLLVVLVGLLLLTLACAPFNLMNARASELPDTNSGETSLQNCFQAQRKDTCRLPGERMQEPADSTVDLAKATAYLALNKQKRQDINTFLPGMLPDLFEKGREGECEKAERHGGGVDRTLLVALVPAFGGSTALLQFLMSNSGISTLCRGNMWECEGSKLGVYGIPQKKLAKEKRRSSNVRTAEWLKAGHVAGGLTRHMAHWTSMSPDAGGQTSAVRPFIQNFMERKITMLSKSMNMFNTTPEEATWEGTMWDAVATWSHIWDLRRPVLLTKDPDWYHDVIARHSALLRFPGAWPIRKVRPVYALMWRPLCMATMSSHFKSSVRGLEKEVRKVEKAVKIMKWAKEAGVHMIVFSYADLLWRPDTVRARFNALLPCIAKYKFRPDWTPTLGVDIFPHNKWKANGSIAAFSSQKKPEKACYDVKTSRCLPDFWTACGNQQQPTQEQQRAIDLSMARYNSYAKILQHDSSVKLNL